MIALAAAALIGLTFTAPADTVGAIEPSLTFTASCATADSAERPLPLEAHEPATTGATVRLRARVPADWIGRRAWVRAVDASGNESYRSNCVVVIAGPTLYALGVPGDTSSVPPFRVDPDSLLDDFAGDGALREEWLTSGSPRREAGHLTLSEPIRWQARPYPALQQAWLTLRSAAPAKIGLLLKVQSNGDRIEVAWQPPDLIVRTRAEGTWTTRGQATVPAVLGDVLSARCDSTGNVYAYRNGLRVASVDCSGWSASKGTGMVGLSATGTVWADDVGAGGWQYERPDPLATQDTIIVSTLGRDRSGIESRWTTASANDPSLRVGAFAYRDSMPARLAGYADSPYVLRLEDLTDRALETLCRTYGYVSLRGRRIPCQ